MCRIWLAWIAAAAFAQDARIRTEVPLVVVPVSVIDRAGHSVNGLGEEAFRVFDDGHLVQHRLDSIDAEPVPVSVVIAVQRSIASAAVLAKVRKVGSMIQPVLAGDRGEAAVLAFDSEVHLLQDFTADPGRLSGAMASIDGGPPIAGSMVDAVEVSSAMLAARARGRKRVLVLISETRDRGSRAKLVDALNLVQREGILVYAATYSTYLTPFTAKPEDAPPIPGGPNYLQAIIELTRVGTRKTTAALCQASGGRQFSFLTKGGLEHVLGEIGDDLHSRYLLSFVPFSPAPSKPRMHSIRVEAAGYTTYGRGFYWHE